MVTAHPDDVDFGAAATVAAWTGAGIDVTYCVITDGQAGIDLPRGRPRRHPRHPAPGAARRREAVGVQDVRFLGYVDGELEVTRALVHDLVRVLRQVRPQRVLISAGAELGAPGPLHPDHLAGGEAATQALFRRRATRSRSATCSRTRDSGPGRRRRCG